MPGMDGLEMLKRIKALKQDAIVIMMTAFATVNTAVMALKDGAYDYVTKPFDPDDLSHLIRNATKQIVLNQENETLKDKVISLESIEDLIGDSEVMKKVLRQVESVAQSNSSVIITGESGTGKELIARAIHANSPRRYYPLVSVHCGALTESLLESELFGHEKGAFTDAHMMKQGIVEIANNGTLFLDEIGEISLMIQPKLLRFLQTGEYRRVGGNKNFKSDVRVISATNKNLHDEIGTGKFREDLLYRINVITLSVPPLRERPEDIPLLVDYFLKNRVRPRELKMIEPKALELLMKYDWPGNVRELENVIERASILCKENLICVEDIALPIGKRTGLIKETAVGAGGPQIGSAVSIHEIEKVHIAGVLKTVGWNKNTATQILGISLKTLYTKIQQYNLAKP
jgi:DNA-binding NtrC family response regulator